MANKQKEIPVKRIKNLAVAAVAAAAFMAFLGAGAASATQLCTDGAGGVCTEYSGNITGTSIDATLKTNLANVECEDSHTTINAWTSTGSPIFGEVTALTFTGCQTEGLVHTPCTVTVKNLSYSASFEGK